MNEFWFKPKAYGYGAAPVTWEGWAVVAVFAAVVIAGSIALAIRPGTFTNRAAWTVVVTMAIVALVYTSCIKTDGAWHWRWGQIDNSGKTS